MICRRLVAVSVLLAAFAAIAGAQDIYVSSSRGDDANSGLSKSEPVRTIRRARELGTVIKLRKGDTFYEHVRGGGFSLSPYSDAGSGLKSPVICGFRIIPAELSANLWECGSMFPDGDWTPDPQGCVYRLDLMADGFLGYTDNVSENDHRNIHNIGAIYDPANDMIYGRKVQNPFEELVRDLDFYQPRGEYRYLYVLAGSPDLLEGRELWLSMGADAVRGSDFSLTGIAFQGWGKTAVRGGSNIKVRDCSFDVIGGSIHEYEPHWIRFGNGVEFWADQAVDDEVSGCRFTRIFDTATTIQGPMSREKGSRCRDVHFHDNVMIGCRQDFEVWIRSADGLMPTDCSFTHNKGYDSGNNGFDTQEYNNTHLLHYVLSPYPVEGILIEDNEFYGGMGLYYANTALDNVRIGRNIYICREGTPVIRGLFGKVEIVAPYREDGVWNYTFGLMEDGTVVIASVKSRREAVRNFESFINYLTGGSGFRIKIKP